MQRRWPAQVHVPGGSFPGGSPVRPGGELSGPATTDRVTVYVDQKVTDSRDRLICHVVDEDQETAGGEWIIQTPQSPQLFIALAPEDVPEHLRIAHHEAPGNPDEIGFKHGPPFTVPHKDGWRDPLSLGSE